MADLTINSLTTLASSDSRKVTGIAAVSIAAGQALYRDAAGLYRLASASTLAEGKFEGIALCAAESGQPVVLAWYDPDLDIGSANLSRGQIYCVSSNAPGAVAPIGDLTAGDYVTVVGIANGSRSIYITNETGNRSTVAKGT
jgi:hypothetical protein